MASSSLWHGSSGIAPGGSAGGAASHPAHPDRRRYRPRQVIGPHVEAKGRCGLSMREGHHNALGPRPCGVLPCSRAEAGWCAQVVAHLSSQEHTRLPCNVRSSVFIRMKLRIGWRTWNVDTSSMSATPLPGSIAPGSSPLRDAVAGSGIPWIARTVIGVHTTALHPGVN
jgi:hypothetical protein